MTPALLLHSGGMSSRQWRRLESRLAPERPVLAPDLLGSGDNPPWPDDAPFEFHMDVEAIALPPAVHLVGHSYGGLLALTLARLHPEKVRSLTLYDPVAFGVLHAAGDAEGLADLARAESNPVFTDPALGGSDTWFEAFVDYWNGPGAWRGLAEGARAEFLRVGRKVYYEVRSLMTDRTPASAYAVVVAPTLLLTGEKSPPVARRVQEHLARTIPHATLQVVEGAGHMGPITHAPLVNDAIARHIASVT